MARAARKTTKNVLTMPRPATAQPSFSDVAKRAFELYCERGCQDGHDVQDWLQAERELCGEASSTAA